MSCCGKKRAEWRRETVVSSRHEKQESIEPANDKQRSSKVFEYTGGQSLSLRGVSSGKTYHFRFPGDQIEVAYEDAFAMTAERELRSVTVTANRT
jgi:hypothetical protein